MQTSKYTQIRKTTATNNTKITNNDNYSYEMHRNTNRLTSKQMP